MQDNKNQVSQQINVPAVVPLIADQQAMHIEFIDLVQSSSNPEIVILSFIQRFPEFTLQPGQNSPEGAGGRLVARFAFTWDHIERMRDLFNRLLVQKNQDIVLEEGEEYNE